jgi:hypothetical protein
LQLGRIRVGRDGDAVGHGGAQKSWVQVSPATVPIELDAPLRRLEAIWAQRKRFANLGAAVLATGVQRAPPGDWRHPWMKPLPPPPTPASTPTGSLPPAI